MREGNVTGETIARRLTAPGRAALASVGVCGAQAVAIIDRLFQPMAGRTLAERPRGAVVFGRWLDGGEELVVSAVAEDEVEIHCHGGEASVAVILQSLSQQGAELVEPLAWLMRRGGDALCADAELALARAGTSRVARILLDQQRGALSEAVARTIDHLARGDGNAARQCLVELLRWAPIGQRLVDDPWRIALVGDTNVGKSTLMNRLLGYERSLVYDMPGVTRDLVTAHSSIDGWPVTLCDTAGLRFSTDELERAGITAARRWVAQADLVLAIIGPWRGSANVVAAARRQAQELAPQATCIAVVNQIDLLPVDAPRGEHDCWISALTGQGVEELLRRMAAALVPHLPAGDKDRPIAVPFRARHAERLRGALDDVQSGHAHRALKALSRLLQGE